ncbi:MAG: lytic murein transglycosylase B, partial [Polaromonas sp.]|nr:lytic murein transglycosylase B [Polaromonas sp.]
MPFYRAGSALLLIAACTSAAWAGDGKPAKKTVAAKPAQAQGPLYSTRPDAMQFADDMAARRDLDPDWVRDAIGQSRYNATVVRLMQPPTKAFVK